MPWSEEKRQQLKRLSPGITQALMNQSEDENGSYLCGYLVKKFTWERSALQSVKKALDEAYLKVCLQE